MTTTKRKVSVSLDEDLVSELAEGDEAFSAQVNEAIRSHLERRRRARLLSRLLAEMDADRGPVEEELIQKYVELLR